MSRFCSLSDIGRTIEQHFGQPQDIEWCLADGTFYVVQSRPITTLYPIPEASDQENRVYVSVAHQQMMTDAMKPLGLSFFQLTSVAPMRKAGGRLFVDITNGLASPASRENLLDVLGQSFPPTRDALVAIVERGDFIKALPDDDKSLRTIKSNKGMTAADIQAQVSSDPQVVSGLIARIQAGLEELKRDIQTKSGTDLFDFIQENIRQLWKILSDPQSMGLILGAMNAAMWINAQMKEWLGETNAADTLSQSVPNNVTAEMGLELLDVADVIRPYPQVVAYLQDVQDDDFLNGLVKLEGGQEAHDAICAYLDKYGMRCAGEIDITKPRWSEKPTTLLPLILSNVKNFEPGAGKRRFEQGRQEALKKEQELLERLRQLPEGEQKAEETKRMIDLVRNFAGFREYPKYSMISYYFVYKLALLKEAERLVEAGVMRDKEDSYYLTFEELREVVRTRELDYQVIDQRKEEYAVYEKLTPPRVITSEGRDLHRWVQARRSAGGRVGGAACLLRRHRGAGASHLEDGRCRVGRWRYFGHVLYGPQLDAAVCVYQRPGHRSWGADDAWGGDRTGVWDTGRGRGGSCDAADTGWAEDPGEWDGRVRRDSVGSRMRARRRLPGFGAGEVAEPAPGTGGAATRCRGPSRRSRWRRGPGGGTAAPRG